MLGGSQKFVTQCSTTTRGNTNQYLKAELQYIYRRVVAMSNYNVKGQREALFAHFRETKNYFSYPNGK